MADDPDVTPPNMRQAARDAAVLLRQLRHGEPKTLPAQPDPEEDR